LFTVPAIAVVGAAAVSIPIAIHLMSRMRRRPEPWGAMRFLLEAFKKQRKRLKLERLLLLALRCLLVLFAGLALSGPLLSGCSAISSAGLGLGQGRVVYLVIDDALSTHTQEAGGTRHDRLKDEALAILDEIEEGDRAVVIRMGRPASFVIEEPTDDKEAVRAAIESIGAGYGRSDLVGALSLVRQSLDEQGVRDGQGTVALLSDFSRSSPYLSQELPSEIEGLGERVSFLAATPAKGVENIQVEGLLPHRSMVVSAGSSAGGAVRVRATLRRFGGQGEARTQPLVVSLMDAEGNTISQAERTLRWHENQPEVEVNFDLPAPPQDASATASQALVVRAQLVSENEQAGVDVLSADDTAFAVVRLRNRLRIAIVDDQREVNDQPGAIQPYQWAQAALSPMGDTGDGPFELSMIDPLVLNEESLNAADAVIVLRPDRLSDRAWQILHAKANTGALVWVFVPAVEDQAGWPGAMKRTFNLPWDFSDSLVLHDTEQGGPPGVDDQGEAPAPLTSIAADWREKLGWIRVSSRLGMSVPAEDRWIRMNPRDTNLTGADQSDLMAARWVGDGALVFTATALDGRYTNLVFRQLFVSLMHDTLRGVLGNLGADVQVVAGDAPRLGRLWQGTDSLSLLTDLTADGSEAAAAANVGLIGEAGQAHAEKAFDWPGVYSAATSHGPMLLPVNVDAAGGDTYPASVQLERLLDELGAWSYIEQRRQEGKGTLVSQSHRKDWTWPLLWLVLALLLLETYLARMFSHALDHNRASLASRAIGSIRGETPQSLPDDNGTSLPGEKGRAA